MLTLFNIAICLLGIKMYIDIVETRSMKHKRAVWNLAYQMTHYFGSDQATSLLDYGCYCGWYGSGKPVDGLDQCCKDHDDCYGRVDACWPKTWPYSYGLQNETVNCHDRRHSCERRVCMCDKMFANCLHNNTYNPENYNIDHDTQC